MIQPTVGFIVYGVHKDGLKDPMGTPFIDEPSLPLVMRNMMMFIFTNSLKMKFMTPPAQKVRRRVA